MLELSLLSLIYPLAAAGWALIFTWLLGGGVGVFLLLFVLLKVFGK